MSPRGEQDDKVAGNFKQCITSTETKEYDLSCGPVYSSVSSVESMMVMPLRWVPAAGKEI